jgi:hypothetical protein
MKREAPCEDRRYVCNCGTEAACVETLVNMFGSLVVSEREKGRETAEQFRDACAHFDRLVTGFCAPPSRR